MREILFRGKRKDNGEWVYGNHLFDDVSGKHYIVPFGNITESEKVGQDGCCYCVGFEVIPSTVEQYTGLTDKNGKKIFEGDIIRFDENLYTVQRECDTPGGYWAETGYILKHIGWSDYMSFTSTIDDWENECQVFIIGNIHDNPELLNEKKETNNE